MRSQRSACIETMYRELPFLDRFRAAGDDGFDFAEFWSWTDKDLDAVRAAAAAAGIGIAGFNGDAELSLIDPAQKGPIWPSSGALWRRRSGSGPGPSPSIPTAWCRRRRPRPL